MGIKRWIGGTADFVTGNRWDFDKRNETEVTAVTQDTPSGTGADTAQTDLATQVGNLRKGGYGGNLADKYYSYPLKRSTDGTEDSLLIQAVKYVPPDDTEAMSAWVGGKRDDGTAGGLSKGEDSLESQLEKSNKVKLDFSMGKSLDWRYRAGIKNLAMYTKFFVELPIPQKISDTTSVTWGESNMNLFTLAGLDIAGRAVEEENYGAGLDVVNQMITRGVDLKSMGLEGSDKVVNAVKAAIGGLAVNQFGANVTTNSVMSRASGQILNSNKEMLFDGVNLRSFAFDVTFTPREKDEADLVMKIIRNLKISMAAKAGGGYNGGAGSKNAGAFLGAPDIFLLKYMHKGEPHPFLHSFKPCALAQMSVDYTGGGNWASYHDGTPIQTRLQMQFKETNPIYAEDYEQVAGVGY